jgi:UDP-glucose 4-epimerase
VTTREPLAWVVGAGGLLGSQLTEALSGSTHPCRIWRPSFGKWKWGNLTALADQFHAAAAEFASRAAHHSRWTICWADGNGVVTSSDTALQVEVDTWNLFLDAVTGSLAPLAESVPGFLFLASSAGGVFGNNPDQPLTELSAPRPISAYGRARLAQEESLHRWAQRHSRIRYLIGRISNLYGPGQNLAKGQGLLSRIASCLVHNRALHLYVPLDTIRDYISADSCAHFIVRCMAHLADEIDGSPGYVKVIASESDTSLAQIIALFRRVSHRPIKLICSPSPLGKLQPSRLRFRSVLWRELGVPSSHTLQADIRRLYQHHLDLHQRGQLPVPA